MRGEAPLSAVNWFGQAAFGSPEFDDDAGALISLPVSREAVAIVFSPDHLAALAEQECKGGRPHIRLTKATSPDRWAPQMARMFRDELTGGNGVNELYVDALLTCSASTCCGDTTTPRARRRARPAGFRFAMRKGYGSTWPRISDASSV
ncbi:protein of unknown function [Nitratireductor aquimarinus]